VLSRKSRFFDQKFDIRILHEYDFLPSTNYHRSAGTSNISLNKEGGCLMSDRESQEVSIKGIVTSRTCDCCGHHEIGMKTHNGEFIRIRPGMKIAIFVEKK
jgi:hypothetical protein